MNDTLKREVQTLYRMGATHRKLWSVYHGHCNLNEIHMACRKLPRDLRNKRILELWAGGKTCKEICSSMGYGATTVRSVTKGIRGGRWDKTYFCNYCGKEFEQRRHKNSAYCRRECRRRAMSLKRSARKRERNVTILELRASGMTLQSIADRFDITRQRVWKIIQG